MDKRAARRVLRDIDKIPHKHFVVHGARKRQGILVPRRPLTMVKYKKLRKKAVYATQVTAIAVLYATNNQDLRWMYAGKGVIEVLKPAGCLRLCSGYIHVCPKIGFKGVEFRGNPLILTSRKPVKPVRSFRAHPVMLQVLFESGGLRLVEKFS